MEKIRTLIVDDEALARDGIRQLLECDPAIEVIGECASGNQAVASILSDSPDLVFLDIQMPRLGGFAVIETVGISQMPQVIFVTAYDKYALKAFEVHALDYLLKPIDEDQFEQSLTRAKNLIYKKNIQSFSMQVSSLLENLKDNQKYLERLTIKATGRYLMLNVKDINWIEAHDKYVKLHTAKQTHLLHMTMNSLEGNLDPETFLRIHRSAIVNIWRIKELHRMFHGNYEVLLEGGARLTLSKAYREGLQKLLGTVL